MVSLAVRTSWRGTGAGSKGIDAKKVADETYPVGRLSWRQINNYLELHNK